MFKRIRKDKEKYHAAGDLYRQRTERTPHKCFICRSVDLLIDKYNKPPKDNGKQQNQVRFNERGNHASQKEYENGDDDKDNKIYASMV